MSSKTRNAAILQQICACYASKEDCICTIGQSLSLNIHPPWNKLNVLLLDAQSNAGSQILKQYIESDISRPESEEIIAIFTHAKAATHKFLPGEATVVLYPYLQPLQEILGDNVSKYLGTWTSASTAKNFPMVDFIVFPSLKNGLKYPFDIVQAFSELARISDLILFCVCPEKVTLGSDVEAVIRLLGSQYSHQTWSVFERSIYIAYILSCRFPSFYIDSSDENVIELSEKRKILKDILSSQKRINIQTMNMCNNFLNNLDNSGDQTEPSQPLQEISCMIEQAIDEKVVRNLCQLQVDTKRVLLACNSELEKLQAHAHARRLREKIAEILDFLSWIIPIITFLAIVANHENSLPALVRRADHVMTFLRAYKNMCTLIHSFVQYGSPFSSIASISIPQQTFGLVILSCVCFIVLNLLAKITVIISNQSGKYGRHELEERRSQQAYLIFVLQRHHNLFLDYLQAYKVSHDLRIPSIQKPR